MSNSAKVAICIGDYSNGWSNAIIVQNYLPFSQEKLQNDNRATMEILSNKLLEIMDNFTSHEKINPVSPEKPCCDKFETFAKINTDTEIMRCPYCGKTITKERREKYLHK